MTDIVERLRQSREFFEQPPGPDMKPPPEGSFYGMFTDAADEIERLRLVARSRKRKKDCAVAARNEHATGLDYWRERALAAETALAALKNGQRGET